MALECGWPEEAIYSNTRPKILLYMRSYNFLEPTQTPQVIKKIMPRLVGGTLCTGTRAHWHMAVSAPPGPIALLRPPARQSVPLGRSEYLFIHACGSLRPCNRWPGCSDAAACICRTCLLQSAHWYQDQSQDIAAFADVLTMNVDDDDDV